MRCTLLAPCPHAIIFLMDCDACHNEFPDAAVFCPRCGTQRAGTAEPAGDTYAAFISYRHLPRDAAVAQRVQKAIETYRLPRSVKSVSGRRLGKCFRDEDELAASHSLPDSIRNALAHSRCLVVICSPETQESPWVRREIDLFMQLHGRERIICVLAAGDSASSIPSVLKTRLLPDTKGVMHEMPTEPLAADLRPEARSKARTELLRVIAAVAGCNFDALRQRDRARRLRRIIAAAFAALLISSALVLALFQAHTASQNALAAESLSLAAQSQEQFERGERMQAVRTALDALPESEGDHSRPFVPEAQEALERALEVNTDTAQIWQPNFVLDAKCDILSFASSLQENWIATLEQDGFVRLYSAKSGRWRKSINLRNLMDDPSLLNTEDWFITAVGNYGLVIANGKGTGQLACVDTRTGDARWIRETVRINAVAPSEDGSEVALFSYTTDQSIALGVANGTTGELFYTAETNEQNFEAPITVLPSVYDKEHAMASVSLGAYVLSFSLSDDTYRPCKLGITWISSLKLSDGVLVAGSSAQGSGESPYLGLPYLFAAASTAGLPAAPIWEIDGSFSYSATGPAFDSLFVSGNPCVQTFLFEGEPAVACTAGRELIVASLNDGRIISRESFDAAIVAVGAGVRSEEDHSLDLVLANGTLNARLPELDATLHGDVFETRIPYQVDQATLELDENAEMCAIMHAANQPTRLLSYRLDSRDYLADPVEYSLDELLAQAHELLGE